MISLESFRIISYISECFDSSRVLQDLLCFSFSIDGRREAEKLCIKLICGIGILDIPLADINGF
mgnify:CR=1 FL=1